MLGSKEMELAEVWKACQECWALFSRGWQGSWQLPPYTEFPISFAPLAAPGYIWMATFAQISVVISCLFPNAVAILVSFMKGFIETADILTDLSMTILRHDLLDVEKKQQEMVFLCIYFFYSLQSLSVSSPR